MSYSFASSAAVNGSIKPALFTPSVNRIITLLLELLSLILLTDVASPIPIAVPPSIILLYFISLKDFNIMLLSVVNGVFV